MCAPGQVNNKENRIYQSKCLSQNKPGEGQSMLTSRQAAPSVPNVQVTYRRCDTVSPVTGDSFCCGPKGPPVCCANTSTTAL
jgi:hypothetical protein